MIIHVCCKCRNKYRVEASPTCEVVMGVCGDCVDKIVDKKSYGRHLCTERV